jgi:hypothetical protein
VLRTKGPDLLRRRANEDQTSCLDRHGEIGVLAEEAVAGVNGLGAGLASDRQHLLPIEVAFGRGSGPD